MGYMNTGTLRRSLEVQETKKLGLIKREIMRKEKKAEWLREKTKVLPKNLVTKIQPLKKKKKRSSHEESL